jgi:uncharacterized protein YkwD
MRSPRTITVGLAVVVALTALTIPGSAASRLERRRDHMMVLVNDYRRHHGLVPLKLDADLNRMAQHHSVRMATERRLFHTNDLGTKLRTFRVQIWGENLGYAQRVWTVFNLWTRSSEHNANLLRAGFRRAGIGVVDSGGVLWITMVYYG